MGAGKNKTHRKKRISKHVLQAEERRKQAQVEEELMKAAEGSNSSVRVVGNDNVSDGKRQAKKGSPSKATSFLKTKDPEEAASYLSLWKIYHRSNAKSSEGHSSSNAAAVWKFNKNTQSWILRHMYDADKIPKATFATLLDYLRTGGQRMRIRVEEDAKRRILRYKDWEKKEKSDANDDDDNENGTAGESNSKSHDFLQDGGSNKNERNDTSQNDVQWNQLDEHNKRKEYKRARKVLEVLKDVRQKNGE